MSNACLDAAFDSSVPEPPVRFVLVALADQANDDGLSWPAVDSIVLRTGLSIRTVQRALAWLVENGHISYADGDRSRGGMPGNRSTTRYILHPTPCPVRSAKKEARRAARGEQYLPGWKKADEGSSPDTGVSGTRVSHSRGRGVTQSQRGVTQSQRGVPVTPEPSRTHRNPKSEPAGAHTRAAFHPVIPDDLPPDLGKAIADWLAYKAQRGEPYVAAGWHKFLARCRRFSPAAMIAAFDESIEQGWSGTFPERHASGTDAAPKKKEGPPAALQSGVIAVFRERFPEFRGEFSDIPLAERRLALTEWEARKKKEGAA